MTQLDKLRAMTVEEVAEERVWIDIDEYMGEFGSVKIDFEAEDGQEEARAEAIRLEMEWLESEVPMPVAEGMCCDCIRPNRHSICGDYSENNECKYRLEDGSCWAGKEVEGKK